MQANRRNSERRNNSNNNNGANDKKGDESQQQGVSLQELQRNLQEQNNILDEEKANRNYFQLERDKIYSLWEIAKKELQSLKATLRNIEQEIEELEEKHQVELKVYKQKVRHLLYEQKITLDRIKIESENALKQQSEEFKSKQEDLKNEKRLLKKKIAQLKLVHEENVKSNNLNNERNINKLKEGFDRQLNTLQQQYDEKVEKLREDLELRAKKDAAEVEERKNAHIKELMKKHDQAFNEIKKYYSLITTKNLTLIKELKEEVQNMEKSEANNERLIFEIAEENKKLSEPLSVAFAEIDQLKRDLANREKDKLSLVNAKSRIVMLESQFKDLKWEHEVLQQSHKQAQRERDDLYEKFEKTINDIHQKSQFKHQTLELRIMEVKELVEQKDAQLMEVMKNAGITEETLDTITSNVAVQIEDKNQDIHDIQFQIEKMKKTYTDLKHYARARILQFGGNDQLANKILSGNQT